MKNKKRGFTLIELLVVVLIIGILSAIALPQYQKAVRKARIAEVRVNLRAIMDSIDRFILENGPDAPIENDLSNLDISISTNTKNWAYFMDECVTGSNGKSGCRFGANPNFESGYTIYYHSLSYGGGPEEDVWAGNFQCAWDNEESKKICAALGTLVEEDGRYILN